MINPMTPQEMFIGFSRRGVSEEMIQWINKQISLCFSWDGNNFAQIKIYDLKEKFGFDFFNTARLFNKTKEEIKAYYEEEKKKDEEESKRFDAIALKIRTIYQNAGWDVAYSEENGHYVYLQFTVRK